MEQLIEEYTDEMPSPNVEQSMEAKAVCEFLEKNYMKNITLNEYIAKAACVSEKEHTYLGIAIYGEKKKVNKLTGFMPLLR